MSQEWIHLITATKTPQNRGSNNTPFENYPDGFDPNPGNGFGPGETHQFLPVTRNAEPTIANPVLQKAVKATTQSDQGVDIDGAYVTPGTYADGDWIVSYTVTDQDLDVSKTLKKEELSADKLTTLSAGYTIGQYNLAFTEEVFAALTSRKTFMSNALLEGDIIGTDTIVLQDANGRKVQLTNAQLQNHYSLYGLAFTDIDGIEIAAEEEIDDATTPAQVDTVTWNFDP